MKTKETYYSFGAVLIYGFVMSLEYIESKLTKIKELFKK